MKKRFHPVLPQLWKIEPAKTDPQVWVGPNKPFRNSMEYYGILQLFPSHSSQMSWQEAPEPEWPEEWENMKEEGEEAEEAHQEEDLLSHLASFYCPPSNHRPGHRSHGRAPRGRGQMGTDGRWSHNFCGQSSVMFVLFFQFFSCFSSQELRSSAYIILHNPILFVERTSWHSDIEWHWGKTEARRCLSASRACC